MELVYRKADANDLMTYFRWANDPETRRNSFNSAQIEIESHKRWFINKLHSDKSQLLIFENNSGEPVGQVRIENLDSESVISISIDQRFRGKALSVFMIDSACKEYFSNFAEPRIHAYIKENNPSSRRAFENAGFHLIEECIIDNEKSQLLSRENV
jgi:RimJ/RimL family protein N-acetyltransferase